MRPLYGGAHVVTPGEVWTEEHVLGGLLDAFQISGWLAFHSRRSDLGVVQGTGARGLPDILAVHPDNGELVAIECKAENGRLSHEQWAWIWALRNAGITAVVCRPAEYDRCISAILRRGTWPDEAEDGQLR
jgi:hypothetical protein